jgi:hypothetical protein
MVGTRNLTEENAIWIATLPGQAHFAIDDTHSCRECQSWGNHLGERTSAGLLRPGLCRKARAMSSANLPEVPHQAKACKHFEANPTPPPI